MGFWKLLATLWRSGSANSRARRRSPLGPTVASLNDAHQLDHNSSAVRPDLDVSERMLGAEVLHLSSHRIGQSARSQSRIVQLSVAVVDYLLEHEWLSLLVGRRIAARRSRRARWQAPPPATDYQLDPIDEANRTACVEESRWSIVTEIGPGATPSWTVPRGKACSRFATSLPPAIRDADCATATRLLDWARWANVRPPRRR